MKHTLSVEHFNQIKSLLHQVAGITLGDNKRQMVENRINKRIKTLNLPSYEAYLHKLETDKKNELVNLVNALTTNVTNFFRESHHFDHLGGELSNLIDQNRTDIKIWSAGCSIGAEPYSAAITLKKTLLDKGRNSNVKILATDIDTIALAQARKGEYKESIVKGLSRQQLMDNFSPREEDGTKFYTVKDNIRRYISYNYFNLNTVKWPMSGPFDFIFCRNVLIYFKRDKQTEYITKMLNLLRPGGFIYLGHSEHLVMDQHNVDVKGQTIYQKPF